MIYPEAFTRNFLMHRQALIELLERFPEDKEELSAYEGGMSVSKTAFHILASAERTAAMVKQEAVSKPNPSASFSETKARLKSNTQALQTSLPLLSPEQLSTTVEAFGGRQMPIFLLLEIFRDHEIHHKGQIWTLARLAGLEPGMFMKLG
jgi:uncharacterized damage-inducible protein DinB